MTPARLRSICADWQRRLRLEDWKIDVRFCRRMPKPEDVGSSDFDPTSRQAWIRILWPKLMRSRFSHCRVEQTLVHELLHLQFQGHLFDVPEFDVNIERAIDSTADCLVDLAHGRG